MKVQFGKPGPWDNEPDDLAWHREDYELRIRRNDSGSLCGYIGVPKGHPWYGQGHASYDADTGEMVGLEAEVHGGLTYAKSSLLGEEPGLWWLGFDCGHVGDVIPAFHDPFGDTYWTVGMVEHELRHLQEQAKLAADKKAEA